MRCATGNQRGVSLIAAIFIIVILAFMGVMFVSLIGSSSFTTVNDLQSSQALYIAEGGVELAQYALAQNLDWYRSADPVPAPASTTQNLGGGPFTVSATLPATKLSRRLQAGDTTAFVYSTGRFPNSGYLQVESNIGGGAEFVHYTGTTSTTFTNLTRGQTMGTIGTLAAGHPRGSSVYPVSTLTQAGGLAASCSTPATFTIGENQKLLGAGTLDIEGEEIAYGGSSTSGGVTTLTGVQRCMGSIGPVAHAQGQPVTPVLDNGDTAHYEAEIVSAGAAGSAARTVRKTVQRQ